MTIQKLTKQTLKDAIILKIACWTEELNGVLENTLSFDEEYAFWLDWMQTGKKHSDQRCLYGMFENEKLIGAIFTSFAEDYDHPNAIEINGLWVDPLYRGLHIAKKLLGFTLKKYQHQKKEKVIVYNHHDAPSNAFYHRLGGRILRKDLQMDGKLAVDVFIFSFERLLDKLSK